MLLFKRAFIFDMDGTMVDNMMVHFHAWQQTLADYGLLMTMEEVIAECHGKNEEIVARLFGKKYTKKKLAEIASEKEARYRKIFLPQLKLTKGLSELMKVATSLRIPMGIGSAAPRANVDFVLDNLQLRSCFKAVVDADDVNKGKPDPTVFFKVAELLGVSPEYCLVFEDSPTGARTAQNAGMKAIIINSLYEPEAFKGIDNIIKFVPNFASLFLNDVL